MESSGASKRRCDEQTGISIERAETVADLQCVRELIAEYSAEQWRELVAARAVRIQAMPTASERGAGRDLADLPGRYAPPNGLLLLARASSTEPAGCVGLVSVDRAACEMKRLYVRPQFRRRGIGRLLVLAASDAAGSLGYEILRLDTVPVFKTAPALFQQLGLEEIPPFDSPPSWLEGGMRAFQLRLTPAANRQI